MANNGNQRDGGNLRDRRIAADLTQEKLARLADCSTSSVKFLEKGLTPERSDVLTRIERVLAAFAEDRART